MPTLSATRISELLEPYLHGADPASPADLLDTKQVIGKLQAFLDLLLRWNARTNLTAIREPEAIVSRHFGESLFTARLLNSRLPPASTLLDFGSGAGFPGLPIQLFRPDLRVTLAESQGKKAAFLREAVRTLGLPTEIWTGRVDTLPANRRFDCITLRAVDRMDSAIAESASRLAPGSLLAILAGIAEGKPQTPEVLSPWEKHTFNIPESDHRQLQLYLHPILQP